MTSKFIIAGLGEILWDVFPDGARFGGAPANFACSAAGIGGDAVSAFMASAVGRDQPGEKALQILTQKYVDVSCVAIESQQTGQVLVTLDPHGKATYEFAANTAWDNLNWTPELEYLASTVHAVCFGTLGQRSETSRRTIRKFVTSTSPDCLRILDINLRRPFWEENTLLESIPLANVMKLNDEELPVVASLLKLKGTDMELLQALQRQFSFRLIALTRGGNGSLLLAADGTISDLPGEPTTVIDTVGAGDAFTAAMAVGLLNGWPLSKLHQRAAQLAGFVCGQPGATPEIPEALQIG